MLLIAPAAYHRLVEHGEDSERFHRVASGLLLAALVPLALGIAGDLLVVVRKVTTSVPTAVAAAVTCLLVLGGAWFGFTLHRRGRDAALAVEGDEGSRHGTDRHAA